MERKRDTYVRPATGGESKGDVMVEVTPHCTVSVKAMPSLGIAPLDPTIVEKPKRQETGSDKAK